jgi:peroxiredoxin
MSNRAGAVAIALLLAAGLAWVVFGAQRPAPPVGEGHPAPDFMLPTLDGGEVRLSSLRGRVVLLNFWATWCKPCEDEMPAMQRLHAQLGAGRGGFELLAVSVDDGDDEVRAFRDRLGLRFPILRDPGKRVAGAYQTFRFPESWLIDAEGTLVTRYVGPREWDDPLYVERIRKLVPGRDSTSRIDPLPSAPRGGPVRREVAIALAIVGAAAAVAMTDEESGVRTWRKLRRDLAVAEARVAELEARIEKREAEAASLQSNPLALERAIREDLGLARPGEIVVRGLDGTPRNP